MNEAEKWLKKLVGDRYVEPKEESKALPYFMYSGDPADNLDRIRAIRKARDRQDKKKRRLY